MKNLNIALIVVCVGILSPFAGVQSSPCEIPANDAVVQYGYHCLYGMLNGFIGMDPTQKFPSNFYNLTGWKTLCESKNQLPSCIEKVMPLKACSNEHRRDIVHNAQLIAAGEWKGASFYPTPGSCDGDTSRDNVTKLYSSVTPQCKQLVVERLNTCLKDWLETRSMGAVQSDSDPEVKRLAETTYQCIIDDDSPSECGQEGEALSKFIMYQTFPPVIRNNLRNQSMGLSQVHDLTPWLFMSRATVGVYGDPHLMVFVHPKLMTCEVAGQQDYLKNPYIKVSGHASPVSQGSSRGTALTQLKISFYNNRGEVSAEYEAANGMLPDKLMSGIDSGMMAGDNEVKTIVVTSNYYVRLVVKSLGLVFHIRRWDAYYSLAIRASIYALKESQGLLVEGCAQTENIDISGSPNSTVEAECERACSVVNPSHQYNYNQACLFDCKATGDTEIANMSVAFKEMVYKIEQDDSSLPLIPYTENGNSATAVVPPGLGLPLIVTLVVLRCIGHWCGL